MVSRLGRRPPARGRLVYGLKKAAAALMVTAMAAVVVARPALAHYDDGAKRVGLSDQMRDMIETALGPRFVYPDTTLWYYDSVKPYLGGGTLVCGHVKSENSARVYMALRPFFAVIRSGKVSQSGFGREPEHDVTGSLEQLLENICPESMAATAQH